MTEINNGLWKAADVIGDLGFVKRHLNSDSGSVCALGAYNVAYDREPVEGGNDGVVEWANENHSDEMNAVSDVIKSLYPERMNGFPTGNSPAKNLMRFNDNVETTKEDVQKVFRIAALKLATGV